VTFQRAFVTGAGGFIGSFVVRQLLHENKQVAILRRPDSNFRRIADIHSQLVDITSTDASLHSISKAFNNFSPEVVFHLGWAGVTNTERNNFEQITKNVSFTAELAKISADTGVKCWIGAGSQAEYGPKPIAIKETFPTEPTTLYGAAKLASLILAQTTSQLAGMRFAWLRIFSTYGPTDNSCWMIPSLIQKLLNGERPTLTNGEQLWDYLNVEDAARAFTAVANSNASGIFNLGSGSAQSLKSIIECIRDMIDPSLPLGFGEVPYRPDQVMCLRADISKLTKATDWEPKIQLADGIKQLINWYRSPHSSVE
jgi:UDP-glucose 4-epimerase